MLVIITCYCANQASTPCPTSPGHDPHLPKKLHAGRMCFESFQDVNPEFACREIAQIPETKHPCSSSWVCMFSSRNVAALAVVHHSRRACLQHESKVSSYGKILSFVWQAESTFHPQLSPMTQRIASNSRHASFMQRQQADIQQRKREQKVKLAFACCIVKQLYLCIVPLPEGSACCCILAGKSS